MSDHLTNQEKGVLDLVDRKGPITVDGLMDHIGAWSRDEVTTALETLEATDRVVEREKEFEQGDVTYTRELWSVDTAADQQAEDQDA